MLLSAVWFYKCSVSQRVSSAEQRQQQHEIMLFVRNGNSEFSIVRRVPQFRTRLSISQTSFPCFDWKTSDSELFFCLLDNKLFCLVLLSVHWNWKFRLSIPTTPHWRIIWVTNKPEIKFELFHQSFCLHKTCICPFFHFSFHLVF